MKAHALRLMAIIFTATIAGCGVSDVAISAAATAKLQAEQARQGKETMDKLKSDLDAAAKTEEQQKANADAAN